MTAASYLREQAPFEGRALQRGLVASFGLLFLGACGQAPADVVANTAHCSMVSMTPEMLVRLSRYYGSGDSVPLHVVQACRNGGGCSAVMTYFHAGPPLVSIDSDGALLIELLGGHVSDIHRHEFDAGARTPIPIVVHQLSGRAEAERARFAAAQGQPNRLTDRTCNRAIEAPEPAAAAERDQ